LGIILKKEHNKKNTERIDFNASGGLLKRTACFFIIRKRSVFGGGRGRFRWM